MERKRIGIFIGDVTQTFASRICRTISEKADEYGYDAYFFTLFTTTGDNLLYAEGERKIFELPDYSELDGIIVALDTLELPGCKERLVEKLSQVSCPVVCLRERAEGFYSVMVDETTSMERMIRHFIEVHKFHDICFMTGNMAMEDAQKRLECYKRVMKEYDLKVDDTMIYYGNYWKTRGNAAVDHFLASRVDSYPQAIVCANDYMAISVCIALEDRGIRVPEDICVSGFDDLIEAQQCLPPLSSVAVPFETMAARAVDLIDEVNRGETPDKIQYITVMEKYRDSCGCKRHKVKNEWGNLNRKLQEQRNVNYQTIFMNADLEGVTDEKLLLTTAHKYIYDHAKRMWICLCDEAEKLTEEEENVGSTRLEYTNNMILRSVKSPNGGLQLENLHFARRELIPESTRSEMENGSFFFLPLHYKNHNLGYVVTCHENYGHYDEYLQPWMMNFAVALENNQIYRSLNAMEEIKRVYKEDALTGIPNRRGFDEQARKVYGDAAYVRKSVAIVSVDMDRLKQINDSFGHAAGDDALCRVAKALKLIAGDNMAYGRTGGDEFCVVRRIETLGEGEEFIVNLRKTLEKVNAQYDTEYVAEVSCGTYEVKNASRMTLMRALELSDAQMYEDKRQRKTNRES